MLHERLGYSHHRELSRELLLLELVASSEAVAVTAVLSDTATFIWGQER